MIEYSMLGGATSKALLDALVTVVITTNRKSTCRPTGMTRRAHNTQKSPEETNQSINVIKNIHIIRR